MANVMNRESINFMPSFSGDNQLSKMTSIGPGNIFNILTSN